jgi:hypothetical protein
MTTVIPAVDNKPYINNAEFVKMTVYNANNVPTVYTFSSSYKSEVINGLTYSALGGLLSVGTHQRDIRVTSSDTSIMLSGIGSDNIYVVLANKLKGSLVEIYRGFYNQNYVLQSTVLRFNGVITSYSIVEDYNPIDSTDAFSITVNCSSYKTILANRIAGRQTSPNHWNQYSTVPANKDSVMINVPNLINAYFDFGMPVADKGK